MTLSELKLELIAKIIATNDIAILNGIRTILSNSNDSENEVTTLNEPIEVYNKNKQSVYVFNEIQEQRINKALEQYRNGECISHEEDQIELEKWFREQEK